MAWQPIITSNSHVPAAQRDSHSTIYTPAPTTSWRGSAAESSASQTGTEKRPRRELCYEKCKFCRRDKKKCIPQQRQWPGEKCRRCIEKDFQCSESTTAAPTKLSSPVVETHVNPPSVQDLLDQYNWLQQQLRLLKELGQIKDQYFRDCNSAHHTLAKKFREIGDVKRGLVSAITRTSHSLREQNRPLAATMLFQLLAIDSQPLQSTWSYFPLYKSSRDFDPIIEHIDNLYNIGAVGMAESMQETLLSTFIDHKLIGTEDMEREIFKLVRFNREFYPKVSQIGNALGHPSSIVLRPLPLLHRRQLLKSDVYVKTIIAKGYQTPDQVDSVGRTVLHVLFESIHSSALQRLLTWGVSINKKDMFGRTALHVACFNGVDIKDIKLLLTMGEVEVDSRDEDGQTPLSRAAERGYDAVVKLLLATYKVNVNSKDNNGQTPLLRAAGGGHLAVVEQLLREGAEANAAAVGYGGRTALQAAAGGGHLAVVEQLLQVGAEVNATAAVGYDGRTALQAAAGGGHLAVVERLLQEGAEVNKAAAAGGRTALQAAAGGGHLAVVEQLLQRGAEINAAAGYDGQTALQAAARGGHLVVVERLLQEGAEVNAAAAAGGRTALQAAAGGGHLAVVEQLLQEGAEVNAAAVGYGGRTALQAAAGGGHLAVVERLLQEGAEVNAAAAVGHNGRTALQAAAGGGHLAVVERLLQEGAEVNAAAAVGYNGRTALQAAAGGGHLAVIERLLQEGAEVNAAAAVGYDGRTALQAAAGGGHLAVIERLLQEGADVNAAAVVGYDGRTALQAAAGGGHLSIVKCLRNAGAVR